MGRANKNARRGGNEAKAPKKPTDPRINKDAGGSLGKNKGSTGIGTWK